MYKTKFLLMLGATIAMVSCKLDTHSIESTLESIRVEDMKNHISVLASDEFQGRAPSTVGEEKTINFLAEQFMELGLEPANNGSFFQEVSLVKLTADENMRLDISGANSGFSLKFSDDFIGGTSQTVESINVDKSDVIFIGYGINAPERNWNDYEGIDVKGKTVLMLVNDPGYATLDENLFTGKAMTIYGRWTYKFEEAARQGAKAAIIIHETGAAAYPWGVVQNSWSGPQFCLADNELSQSDLLLQSWVTTESAIKMFEAAGLDYENLTASAAKPGFKAINMNLKASVQFKNQVVYTKSNNVAALWQGSDQSDEYIVYSAHWDHFGVNPAFEGDSILNGAVDNATGTAALLEIAEAFTLLPEKQNRSILFLAVTCEEQGLLGSMYYAEHPLFPLNKTVGAINMDALNILGRTKDMTIIGLGNSELDDYAINILNKHERYAAPDPTPEKGSYFRSDHFSFARLGVPSLYLGKGVDDIEHGKEWALEQSELWVKENYHKPSDNYEPEKWDFEGMLEDIKVYFEIGYDLSTTKEFPKWSPDSPFKAMRDAMMKK